MALINLSNIKNVFIHAFTDGRDSAPQSALKYINKINSYIKNSHIKIGTIIGRYYAMDRDSRWNRTKVAYDLLINSKGQKINNINVAFKTSYKKNITDEFIKPISIDPNSKIQNHDFVFFFNFLNVLDQFSMDT